MNFDGSTSAFDSRDCVDLIYDGPGDTTVCPLRPALLALALAEREKLVRWKDVGSGSEKKDSE
jgi:hypothetical protein